MDCFRGLYLFPLKNNNKLTTTTTTPTNNNKQQAAEKKELTNFSLVQYVHSEGVNIRFLGLILGEIGKFFLIFFSY